ncbi:MAG TPA: hypothetical protein VGM06_17940 [Polyangiaceae bacterium]
MARVTLHPGGVARATLGITVMVVALWMAAVTSAMAATAAEPTAPGPTVKLLPARQAAQTFAA